jgi:hypothetical protein
MINKSKGKATPAQALWVRGNGGIQISRQSSPECGKIVRLRHRPPLPTRNYSWYSFLLEVESITRPYYGRKDSVNEKCQQHQRKSNPRHSTNCATVCVSRLVKDRRRDSSLPCCEAVSTDKYIRTFR